MKKRLKKIILWLMIFAVAGASFLTVLGYQTYRSSLDETSVNEKVSELRLQEHYVYFDQLPEILVNALVSIEDRRFYQRESAFDLHAFGRALWVNISTLSLSEGASTLQQQVAKNLYWDYQTTLTQKIAQMFMMNDVNAALTHDEVIEVYFNIIYFGDGYAGIYEASMGYFNKAPEDLTDAEATLLAGLPQAPSIYQLSTGMEAAKSRQQDVLTWMVEEGYLSAEEAVQIYAVKIEIYS